VWTRTVNGRVLNFYLAGINNQNFLMRDKETGTWWQQITGKAIYGPLQGAALELVLSDELTFGEWKLESPDGKVLAAVPKYGKEYDSDWEPKVAKLPVVISFPGTELKSRDVVVGLELDGASRAYPWDTLVKQSPVVDQVHGTPLLIAVGLDGKSFRVFKSQIDGKPAEFFLKGDADPDPLSESKSKTASPVKTETKNETNAEVKQVKTDTPAPAKTVPPITQKSWTLLDTATASEWNFQGCAISGPSLGKCLDRVPALKDYWFDWRNYHPDTTIYKH
jgi:hypothetical protein